MPKVKVHQADGLSALVENRGDEPAGDLFFSPHSEVNENEEEFRMMISTPGFGPGDIDVVASSLELLVKATVERRLEPTRHSLRAGALESRTLYRRFTLTSPIDSLQVTARIDEGSLTIHAPKKPVNPVEARAAAA